jgi:hypothetical protein
MGRNSKHGETPMPHGEIKTREPKSPYCLSKTGAGRSEKSMKSSLEFRRTIGLELITNPLLRHHIPPEHLNAKG